MNALHLRLYGLLTVLLSIWYLVALFRFLPDDSLEHSTVNMEASCFHYLLASLLLSSSLLIFTMLLSIQRKKLRSEDPILDELEVLNETASGVEEEGGGCIVGVSWLNIAMPIILLLILVLINEPIIAVLLAMVWAIIHILVGFGLFTVGKDQK